MVMSVRGIARQYLHTTGDLSLRTVTSQIAPPPADGGVRARLKNMAREEVRYRVNECIYEWHVGYEQVWSAVVVRIRLKPDPGISEAIMSPLRQAWESTIEDRWSNVWAIGHPGEGPCNITLDVQWVANDPHQTVRVRQGPARSNVATWDTADTGAVASHEFGHMLGNPDEYSDPNCPNRNPVNSGTIMDTNADVIPARLLQRIANQVGSEIVSP
jgi:hypothetical protein